MDIIAMARELGKAIQQDQALQDLIVKFTMKRSELTTEMAQENKDTDKLNTLDKELKEVYAEVMANENMAEFNAAKHEVDDMMNFISTILYGSVNGEDPDTIEMQVGCGGNCASCGGCH